MAMSNETYRKTTIALLSVIAAALVAIAVILVIVLDWGFNHVADEVTTQLELSACLTQYKGDSLAAEICKVAIERR